MMGCASKSSSSNDATTPTTVAAPTQLNTSITTLSTLNEQLSKGTLTDEELQAGIESAQTAVKNASAETKASLKTNLVTESVSTAATAFNASTNTSRPFQDAETLIDAYMAQLNVHYNALKKMTIKEDTSTIQSSIAAMLNDNKEFKQQFTDNTSELTTIQKDARELSADDYSKKRAMTDDTIAKKLKELKQATETKMKNLENYLTEAIKELEKDIDDLKKKIENITPSTPQKPSNDAPSNTPTTNPSSPNIPSNDAPKNAPPTNSPSNNPSSLNTNNDATIEQWLAEFNDLNSNFRITDKMDTRGLPKWSVRVLRHFIESNTPQLWDYLNNRTQLTLEDTKNFQSSAYGECAYGITYTLYQALRTLIIDYEITPRNLREGMTQHLINKSPLFHVNTARIQYMRNQLDNGILKNIPASVKQKIRSENYRYMTFTYDEYHEVYTLVGNATNDNSDLLYKLEDRTTGCKSGLYYNL
jgi:hypothetical protein